MQTRRTHRFRPNDPPATPDDSLSPAKPAASRLSAAGFAAQRRLRSLLASDASRGWQMLLLVVLAAVALWPLNAVCRFVVAERREVGETIGLALARPEVAETRPVPSGEVARLGRPTHGRAADGGGRASP